MTSGADREQDQPKAQQGMLSDGVRNALVVTIGAAMMMGLAVAAVSMLTAPDGWMMKATHQAMQDQQQAIATSYLVNHGE
jgi:uncharacterized membrane protein YkgB